MRAVVAALVGAVITAIAALDCGGRVDQASACPAQLKGACNSGDECGSTTPDGCGGTTPITCTCTQGAWSCPEIGPAQCPSQGCNDASPGQSCTTNGLRCEALVQPACVNAPRVYCTCMAGRFVCDAPPSCVNACPPPSTVHDGTACSGNGTTTCGGTESYTDCNGFTQQVAVQCRCMNGSFACPPIFPPPCVSDAGVGPG